MHQCINQFSGPTGELSMWPNTIRNTFNDSLRATTRCRRGGGKHIWVHAGYSDEGGKAGGISMGIGGAFKHKHINQIYQGGYKADRGKGAVHEVENQLDGYGGVCDIHPTSRRTEGGQLENMTSWTEK